jgi:hypothetical protein
MIMRRLRHLLLATAAALAGCSPDRVTAPPVDQGCGSPPEWAQAWLRDATLVGGDESAGNASVNMAGTGPGKLQVSATSTSTQDDRFNSPSPNIDFRMMDFVHVTPNRGWRPNEELYLRVRHVGQAEARTAGEGDRAFIAGGVMFRRIEASSRDGQQVRAEINEVELRPIREAVEWVDFQAHIEGGASVAGFRRTATVSLVYTASILGVVDAQGQPVEATICYASGTRW